MKRNLLFLWMIVFIAFGAKANRENAGSRQATTTANITDGFITTWMTSADNQSIIIPINPSYAAEYNFSVNWGDGNTSTGQTADATHTYAAHGTYTVTITGSFPAIQFGRTVGVTGNNQRLSTVVQWGNGTWKSMAAAFRYCQGLTTVPNINGPIFATGASLTSMFYDCSALNCDLNDWDLRSVNDISHMFDGANAFKGNISDWNVSNVTNMAYLFERALTFNGDISGWDVSNVTLMDHMFENARAFNGNIGHWNVSKVNNMNTMFSLALSFNQDISGWNVSNVTNMYYMFSNAQAFNHNLNSWNVAKVTDMSYMFQGANAFNGDIHSWNVSKVTSMAGMFAGAASFNQNISAWDVRAVRYMNDMFSSVSLFNQDISGWQTNSLIQMDGMFVRASAFNQNIGSWNVSKVVNMSMVFYQATAFNQNLGGWQVGQVTNMQNMLDGAGISASNYLGTLAGWNGQSVQPGIILGAAGLKYCSGTARQSLIGNHSWQILGDRQVCLVPAVPDGAGIVYVDSAVAAPGNGSSWAKALKYLSNATESAKSNTAIKAVHIAKGTYYPSGDKTLSYSDSAFTLNRPGLSLEGGYANGGGQHDIDLYSTVLSGDIGLQADTSDNSSNVMVVRDIAKGTDSLIIDGLTITGGKHNIDFNDISSFLEYNYAGGISIINAYANTVIRNCIFRENYGLLCSALSVAGPDNAFADPTLVATPQILNCLFKDNAVMAMAGGVSLPLGSTFINSAASPYISHSDFIENKGIIGGVVTNSTQSAPVFYNCRFLRNTAKGLGVLSNMQNASATLINCAILDNVNTGYYSADLGDRLSKLYSTAAIGNSQNAYCRLINTTVSNNKSLAAPPLTNSSLILNISESSAYITNSIIWGNSTNTILDSLTSVPSMIAYSLIQGMAADPASHILDGTSNAPIFTDTANGDFQLITSSAAIDAGLNDSLTSALAVIMPAVSQGGCDLAGKARIQNSMVDLGAYEFVSSSPLPVGLKYFTGELHGGIASFIWESGVEDQVNNYQIEKSVDGKSFEKLVLVEPAGSNSHYLYKYAQAEPVAYYRLKMTENTGKTGYSATVKLAQNADADGVILYPNPAKNYLNIRTGVERRLSIYNSNGIFIKTVQLKAGVNKIDISQFSAGLYFGMVDGQKLRFIKL